MSDGDNNELARRFAAECDFELRWQLARIHHCLDQLDEKQLWWRPSDGMNSIGNLILHLAGNLTQWVTHGLGDKPDIRDRPSEFAADRTATKSELRAIIDNSVEEALATVNNATNETLVRTKHVQVREVSGVGSMLHSLMHFYGHTQEIVCLTRQQLGPNYSIHHAVD